MRLVTGVTPREKLAKAKIFLDGVEQQKCTIADDELGYIKKYLTNKHGGIVVHGGRAKEVELYGKVEITGVEDEEKPVSPVPAQQELWSDSSGQRTVAIASHAGDSSLLLALFAAKLRVRRNP